MGTDGGTDTTTRPPRQPDDAALDDDLELVVAGLRAQDLAFVVTAAIRLGPAAAAGLVAAGVEPSGDRVADVALVLADLAAHPATATWSAGDLLAAAVADVAAAGGSGAAGGSPAGR